MPTGVDAAQVAAVVVVLGACAVALRVLLARPRRPESPESAAAPPLPGVEPPWAVVVANPTKITDIEGEIGWLEERSVELGWARPVWLETTPDDPGVGQARVALRAGAHAVLAYGGDGTVRAVGSVLAGTDVPLGLLPAGTGNLLARNLDVPISDLDAALAVALTGADRKIDVGRAEVDVSGEDQQPRSEMFLVMAGLGFDAEVMATVGHRLKERMGWFAYVVTGARNLRGRQTKVRLRIDDADAVRRRLRSVIVGNCGELTGGVRLMPDAEIDDGWLDVVVVAPRGIVGWLAVTGAVLSRSRWGHPVVEHFRCRRIEVTAEKPLHAQFDGDPAGMVRVLRARVDPAALVVRV
ncbi:MAG TPA: diacylglycerol kinase family protein [Kineosporiaceae bacterium]|nr:diacylglycerol kinase family protein [Kineosporiaceae bacterium]